MIAMQQLQFNGGKMILLVVAGKDYPGDTLEVTRQVSQKHRKVCYVTLNRRGRPLCEKLERYGIRTDNFCFIDVASSPGDGVIDRSHKSIFSLNNLTELSLVISEALRDYHPSYLIFDSISTLQAYQKPDVIIKFVHFVINNLREHGCGAVFMLPYDREDSTLIRDLGMFVDKTVHL